MCSDYSSPSFGWPLRVLAPGVSPGFLPSVVLNRIRGFRDFNSENLYQQQPVFLSSYVFSIFDVLHTVINSVYVQNLPTEQATSVVTFFSQGYDTYTHTCKARPLTTVGRTSLSVIIIIILLSTRRQTHIRQTPSRRRHHRFRKQSPGHPKPSGLFWRRSHWRSL